MGRTLGEAIHHYGRVLIQMGTNHAQAEAGSNISGGGVVAPPQIPATANSPCASLSQAPRAVTATGSPR
ncbi:hypothetical protein CH253_29670 [Rhodococcus sp. 06-156-3C]|nr:MULTISPECIES: hypothetical protein [Rhodococcus]OZD11546.1 hypothetical protein CH253_29670 [Rhodococcus sp. 06-156-3C]OZD13782.1 hypothetical protein CH248_27175 [Rhodococcus sp. 06-156-4a]OZD28072.1 hypothetical protein CH247_19985 [Rhodococcus sp. 06-156-3b]OZD30407.1 hypothetical protein CH284_25755 [Rhodococcus sp. 06-156-3]OZD10792.1 hypothetical protein CH280_21290 [Rhodococcus sp. 06-156-4C]